MLDARFENAAGDKNEGCEDNRELWDHDAGCTEGVDNEPRVGEPGDFGGDKTGAEGEKAEFVFVALDEDVTHARKADEETKDSHEDGV